MTKSKATYEEMKQELDEVMAALQQEDLDVDKALEHYKRGLELVRQIESYLKTAETKVTELKAEFGKD